MAVDSENVRKLMEWLAQDSPVRPGAVAAGTLAEKLTALVFQGDAQWPERSDQADGYRDALSDLLAASGDEQQFVALTTPDADPDVFVDWFLTVVTGWESLASSSQQSAEPEDRGDPADAESGRYSEPARDDGYGLTYRYDHQAGAYEWYDEAGQAWRDQAWADQYATGGSGAAAYASADGSSTADSPPAAFGTGASPSTPSTASVDEPAPAWDENWKMFYRVDADGMYQFADAAIPGDKSSGWDETWLSHEQVVARTAGQQQPQSEATTPHAAAADAVHNAMLAAVGSALESDPALKDILTDEHIKAVLADVAREVIG